MTDRVFVTNLCLHGRHGVFPEEARLGQKFFLDIDCEFDSEACLADDDYRSAVNYAVLCDIAAEVSQGGPYKLIETLADRIASAVLQRFAQVSRVIVRVRKPSAPIVHPLDHVGVEIARSRRAEIALSLGSNLGDKVANIRAAVGRIGADGDIQLVAVSKLYRTAPWGKTDQDAFVNAALIAHTNLSPHALLDRLKSLELQLGRTPAERWGPRVIDIDILYYDDREIAHPALILPHRDLFNRAFVLVPLADVAPDRVVAGRRIGDAAATLKLGEGEVVALEA